MLQIPCGYILDSKGFEKIFPCSIFLVLIGCILYWFSDNVFLIGFSRLIIGAGCSSAYIISIFIATKYFNKAIIPLLISFAEIATGIGDYFAGNIYLTTIKGLGWNATNIVTVLMVLFLFLYSLILMRVIKRRKKDTKLEPTSKMSMKDIKNSIKKMFKSSTNIAIFTYSFFTWGIIMTFAGFWAKSYYINMHDYTREYALSLPEIYWMSFLISALIVGAYVKTIAQAKKYILLLSILGVIAYFTMLTPFLFGYSMLMLITIISGISASGVVLGFFIIQYLVTDTEKGLAISLNNLFIVLGGMASQIIFSQAISFNFDKIYILEASVNSFFYSGIVMLATWALFAFFAVIYILKKL
ncbi:MFS transporter [Candidatus Francisella endociliophora]|uniref:MFS transporter n=1 Tax=Candidatus Francisella endociliophora TaxID=653937 RepID=A0A097ERT8_9GAMM|nr:MFS transporter [Francisella sp. FSC1006]